MSKNVLALLLVMVMSFGGLALAKHHEDDAKDKKEGGMCAMHMKGMKKMDKMCAMKMGGDKKMVATSDGGVIILCCHKLKKYDANLNLVKEVDLK